MYKQQVKLVKLAGTLGSEHSSVMYLQLQLVKSLPFRLLAVHKIVTNSGGKSPGIDNILLKSVAEKAEMVEKLKDLLIHAEKGYFKITPVKRVMIPKSNGKNKKKIFLRPLGIPTIQDRCLQALINLVLEPIVEMTSDPNSYGFRPLRGPKNAVASVRNILQSGQDSKWILDADIKSFFDEIDHNWLLDNLPLPKSHKLIVQGWLKSGAIFEGSIIDTDTGKTHFCEYSKKGGIISPVLANLTLNGLEEAVRKSISAITRGKAQRKTVYKEGVRVKMLSFNLKTIRYADEFFVIGTSRRIIENFVKPSVEAFLKERGLRLSPDKTKIFQIESGVELNFLGYTIKYRDN